MEITIVTGMSGSGKSSVIKALEDIGYFCADNIPPILFPQFINVFEETPNSPDKLAIVVDCRLKHAFRTLFDNLIILKNNGYSYKILFIDADDEVLLRRYKETRRLHPLSAESDYSLKKAILRERELLAEAKENADIVFDTSKLSVIQFNDKIRKFFSNKVEDAINVTCVSFGYKYGIPRDCDLVFDVRCLPNPFYIPELKEKTGLDPDVREFVMQNEESITLFNKISDMIDFLLPLYNKEGKTNLIIGFGCSGGQHRSVTFAELLSKQLKDNGYNVSVDHRVLNK